jgi:2-hydroxychromene-2-carboxylate isomerase
LTALSLSHREEEKTVALKMWEFYWCKDKDIADVEVLKQILVDCGVSGAEADKFMEMVGSEDVKEALKNSTEEAVKRGILSCRNLEVNI